MTPANVTDAVSRFSAASSPRARLREAASTSIVWCAAAMIFGLVAWILAGLVWGGISGVSWSFLVTAPSNGGRAGGLAPILVSTLAILAICLAVTVPLGLGTALLLSEFTLRETRFSRVVRFSLDVLAGIPSIVFGLFGNAFFSITLGLGFSILSGGLTLACMALPLFIRATEEGLRAVPDDYRKAGAALGVAQAKTIRRVILPAAAPGIIVGLVLAIGRALAETAALIFTSGYVDRMPSSVLDSGRALSIHIYDLAMNVPGGDRNAYASTLVLIGLLLIINLLASVLTERWLGRRVLAVQ